MVLIIKSKIQNKIVEIKSSKRSLEVFKNAFFSSILKIISIGLSFVMVPLTLDYLSKTGYGLWAALSSVLTWFFIFDIGLGNGLKNKFIELKANNQVEKIKYYVSTAYALFFLLVFIIIIVFFVVNRLINWGDLLNAPMTMYDDLNMTVIILFISLTISFVLKLINTILQADLKVWISNSFSVIYSVINLVGILVLINYSTPSLPKFALLYTSSTLSVTFVASIILYHTMYKEYRPRIKCIQIKLAKDLGVIGVKFFFIQLGSLILFQTTSLILANLVGPNSVADYNITMKYYSIVGVVFTILSQPLWSGYGEAYHKNDFKWIRSTFSNLTKLLVLLIFMMLVLLLIQKLIFSLWLSGKVEVNYTMSLLFIIYYVLQMISGIYEPFINATGKLYIQLRVLMISVPLFIPLTYLLVTHFNFGASGILVAIISVSALPVAIINYVQSRKILAHSTGVWNK